MNFFKDDHPVSRAYNEFKGGGHKASLSHEVLAGAVAFEAAKAYQDHCAKNGKPPTHAKAKELFAGCIGVGLDRLAETKGMDEVDKLKLKHQAEKHGDEVLANQY